MSHATPHPGLDDRRNPAAAFTAAMTLLVSALVLAGCGGEPTSTPNSTAANGNSSTAPTDPTASPNASPSPTRNLAEAERRAYDGAVAAVRKYYDLLAEVESSPSIEKISGLNRAATDPQLGEQQEAFLKTLDFDQRGKITAEVERADLVKVDLQPQSKIRVSARSGNRKPHSYRLPYETPVVVLDICVIDRVIELPTVPGEKTKKKSRPVASSYIQSYATMTQPPFLKGKWAVASLDSVLVESC